MSMGERERARRVGVEQRGEDTRGQLPLTPDVTCFKFSCSLNDGKFFQLLSLPSMLRNVIITWHELFINNNYRLTAAIL